MRKEKGFRNSYVKPFLKSLPRTVMFPIQQMAIRGTPDYLLCVRHFFVALELKAEDGKVSEAQRYNLSCVEKVGGIAIVCSPENWESVKDFLIDLAEEKYDSKKQRSKRPRFFDGPKPTRAAAIASKRGVQNSEALQEREDSTK